MIDYILLYKHYHITFSMIKSIGLLCHTYICKHIGLYSFTYICFVLQIGTINTDNNRWWAVQTVLEVNCTGAFKAYHSERLQTQQNSLSVYVQSDKAMYKGGDLGKYYHKTT